MGLRHPVLNLLRSNLLHTLLQSVLQCVAQCVADLGETLQCVCCSVLQSVLQCVCCSVLQNVLLTWEILCSVCLCRVPGGLLQGCGWTLAVCGM